MKFKYSDLFTFLTGVMVFLSFFYGWFFIGVASVTGSYALIYDAFQKKGLKIKPVYIIGHFVLTCGSIYLTFFSLKLLLTIIFQLLNKQGADIQAFHSLFWPVVIDGITFIFSLTLFISGLFKATRT